MITTMTVAKMMVKINDNEESHRASVADHARVGWVNQGQGCHLEQEFKWANTMALDEKWLIVLYNE